MGILTAISTGLRVVLEALGLWKFFAEANQRAKERASGAREAAGKAARRADEQKKIEEAHRAEVFRRDPTRVDDDLAEWLRD